MVGDPRGPCDTVAVREVGDVVEPVGPVKRERIAVEPSVLRWARESIRLDPERAAKRIGVSAATLAKWESGELSPTISQLRNAAATYRRPLAVLFLPRPAMDFDALRDFRAGGVGDPSALSPELTTEYWRSLSQREVLLELEDLGALHDTAVSPAVALSLDTPIEAAGALLRAWIGIEHTSWRDPRAALAGWISATEAQDVLVIQTRGVETTEMRGFSVSEWPRPVVALNGSDFQRGRLYTLAHELAHLALNAGGLCDLHEADRSTRATDQIELYCNRVAAAALMPREAVLRAPSVARATTEHLWTTDELDVVSRPFGASAESLALRLITLGKATWDRYWSLKPAFERHYADARAQQRTSKGGPSFYVVKARDLGPGYVRTVIDAFQGRMITSLDAADYLDVRFDQIPRLEAAAR